MSAGWAMGMPLLVVLLLLARIAGAPWGEPVADDFDFLWYRRFAQGFSLLDGGGSACFWRPVAHQGYYALLGTTILGHPGIVTVVHSILLSLVGVLLYLGFRRHVTPVAAALMAAFPLLAESARSLLVWPSHFVDLGVIAFSALALYAVARGRWGWWVAAVTLALLTKELAVAAVLLTPAIPRAPGQGGRSRSRYWVAALGVLVLWGAAYAYVREAAGLRPPSSVTDTPAVLLAQFPRRFLWVAWASLRAAFSLPRVAGPRDILVYVAFGAIAAWAAALFVWRAQARARLIQNKAWILWGLGWFAAATAILTTTYPVWAPYRSLYGSIGLGVALVLTLHSAWRWLPTGLMALRLVTMLASPGPAAITTPLPPVTGAILDFQQLTRLQRFMREVRTTLHARYPSLPRGAIVGQHYLPQATEYAFSGSRALQVWYGDSTLRWIRFERFQRQPGLPVATFVEYQPGCVPGVALVGTAAMRSHVAGVESVAHGDWASAIAAFDQADSLENDPHAVVFKASNAYQRAFSLGALGRREDAEAQARLAVRAGPVEANARYVLALLCAEQGRLGEAEAQLDSALAVSPGDQDVLELLAKVRSARRGVWP